MIVGLRRLWPFVMVTGVAAGLVVAAISASVVATSVGARSAPSTQQTWAIRDLGKCDEAEAINNRGQIILDCQNRGGGIALWQDGRLTRLGTFFFPYDLNDRGEMVGARMPPGGQPHAAFWRAGIVRDLPPLARGAQTDAFLLNETGLIVGRGAVSATAQPTHLVIWRNGKIRDLGVPSSRAATAIPEIAAINDRGQVVGQAITSDKSGHHVVASYGFIAQNGKIRPLLPLSRQSRVTDINNRGQAVGWWWTGKSKAHGFLWQGGKLMELPPPPGWSEVYPMSINDRGQVLIQGGDDRPRAAIWQNSKYTELGSLFGGTTWARVMNDRGQVAGESWDDPGGPSGDLNMSAPAFVWQNGTMTNLGTLGGPDSLVADINAAGLIVGRSTTRTGDYHAVLWTPK